MVESGNGDKPKKTVRAGIRKNIGRNIMLKILKAGLSKIRCNKGSPFIKVIIIEVWIAPRIHLLR